MARLEFFVVSRSVSIDQATNHSSIFEILEVIQAPGFPAVLPQCVATSLWRREPGDENEDFQVLLRITTPSEETHEIRSNFRFSTPRHRVMQRIQGLPIDREGELRFELMLNGDHAAEHVVDVSLGGPGDAVETPAKPN